VQALDCNKDGTWNIERDVDHLRSNRNVIFAAGVKQEWHPLPHRSQARLTTSLTTSFALFGTAQSSKAAESSPQVPRVYTLNGA
jgi:hypothetical protein